ncbi:MAG TPA: esterase-like activity of phytase family protein [Nevskiaceae bacterium]|nr:esterase-like activity of phytase family protein [Nevskiaceae bacterium]
MRPRRWNHPGAGLLAILLAALAGAARGGPPPALPAGFEYRGFIRDARLPELSGLAASPTQPGVFWALNDSGNAPLLVRLTLDPAVIDALPLSPASHLDWEDLAAWQEPDGRGWLAVADVGDNFALRPHVLVHLLPEPAPGQTQASPARTLRLRYEDGPRDCEAVAVDVSGRRLLLLDKRRTPIGLYEAPLDAAGGEAVLTARRIASLPVHWPEPLPLVSPLSAHQRGQITAADLSADGRTLVLLTYTHLLRYQRGEGEDWPAALARPPGLYQRLPRYGGFESLALDRDGRRLWLGTEGEWAHLFGYVPP